MPDTSIVGSMSSDDKKPDDAFNLDDHVGAFVAGAKDFGEDMRSMANGELKGPSMKHRQEFWDSKKKQ